MNFDEINAIRIEYLLEIIANIQELFLEGKPKREDVFDFVDEYLEWAFVYGVMIANQELGTDFEPDREAMERAKMKEFNGETYVDRVDKYIDSMQPGNIARVVDTDGNRMFNSGIDDVGDKANATKVWSAILDDRTRDTHYYLDGMEADEEGYFYTYDGDRALHPGDFAYPENNVNCRCQIYLRK